MSFGTSDPQPTSGTPTPSWFGTNLRTVRIQMRLSQAGLAREIRRAGLTLGEPNRCSKRLVQAYERGAILSPRSNYRRAIALATGITYETLDTATPATLPTAEPREPVLPPFDPARLWAARHEHGLSQQKLAEAVAKAGVELGEPNRARKRLIQQWESGTAKTLQANYQRALAHVFGFPYRQLCSDPAPSSTTAQPPTLVTRPRTPVARPASKKARARELRAQGLTSPEIAQQLGISIGTARVYAPVGDLPHQGALKPETIAEVRELYAQGVPPKLINQQTGVSRAYIQTLTAHLPRQRPRLPQDEKTREATARRARELRAQGWTQKAVARELHIIESTVATYAPTIDPIIKAAIRALAADSVPETEIARRFNLDVEIVHLLIRYA